MLNRAGDADRDVELRRDDLARLAYLQVVRDESRVDRGARRADGGAERVGELVQPREVVGAAERAAARDDARGRLQIGAIGALRAKLDEARVRRAPRAPARASSIGAAAAAPPAAGYEAVRTVATSLRSGDARTVTIALPA